MTREIPLTRGYVALVDDEDFDRLSLHKWRAMTVKSGRVYACRTERYAPGKYRCVLMHREIVAAPPLMKVDHVEGVGLDNRKSNLRLATHQQNLCNRRRSYSRTGYMGVAPHGRRWLAYITAHGKRQHLGCFDTAEDAARARDDAATRLHGEFAFLNFPAERAARHEQLAAAAYRRLEADPPPSGQDRRPGRGAGTMGAQAARRLD